MIELFPILIPSRGRPEPCPTARLLEECGVPFTLVVEPCEFSAYADQWGRDQVLSLRESGRGLPYARNAIFDHARAEGLGWFWMLDDDITGFFRVEGKKCVRAAAGEVLDGAQATFADRADVAQAALEYQQFAWSATRTAVVNGYCDVAVCCHAGRLGRIRCRENVDVKLDRDFTLQLLAAGWSTHRTTRHAFACPKNGSNPGGLHEVYAEPGREAAASREMERIWGPEICRAVIKKDGRPDVKINWGHFRPQAV